MNGSNTASNTLVARYRAWMASKGQKPDPRSDLSLTVMMGEKLREQGTLDQAPDDFKKQYWDYVESQAPSLPMEAWNAAKRATRGLKATAMNAGALALDTVGADETAKEIVQSAKELEESGDEDAPTIRSVDEVHDVKSGLRYAASQLGQAAPSLAESAGASLIGAAVGSSAAPVAGTAAGAVAGVASKSLIKKAIANRVAALVARGMSEKAAKQTINAAVGAGLAGAANSFALSSGEIYGNTENPALSVGFGVLAAVPDTVLPGYIATKLITRGVAREAAEKAAKHTFWKELVKELPKTVPMEASTEAFQEAINITAEKIDNGEEVTFGKQDWDRIRESAIGGAAGGLLGAPMAAYGSTGTPASELRPVEKTATPLVAPPARATAAEETEEKVPVNSKITEALRMTDDEKKTRLSQLEAIKDPTEEQEKEMSLLRFDLGIPEAKTPEPAAPKEESLAPQANPQPVAGATEGGQKPVDNAKAPGPLAATENPLPEAKPAKVVPLSERLKKARIGINSLISSFPILAETDQYKAVIASIPSAVTEQTVAEFEGQVEKLKGMEQWAATETIKRDAAKEQAKLEAKTKRAEFKQQRTAILEARRAAFLEQKKQKKEKKPAVAPAVAPVAPAVAPVAQVPEVVPPAALTPSTPPPAASTPVEPPQAAIVAAPQRLDHEIIDNGVAGLFDFDAFKALVAERVAENKGDVKKLLEADWAGILKGFVKGSKQQRRGGFFAPAGNKSTTRTAMAIEYGGKVYLTGLSEKNISKVGATGVDKKSDGLILQNFGKDIGRDRVRSIVPGASDPVLLSDVLANGGRIIDIVRFDTEPTKIFKEFATEEQYTASKNATPVKTVTDGRKGGASVSATSMAEVTLPDQTKEEVSQLTAQDVLSKEIGSAKPEKITANFLREVIKEYADEVKITPTDVAEYLIALDNADPAKLAISKAVVTDAEFAPAVERLVKSGSINARKKIAVAPAVEIKSAEAKVKKPKKADVPKAAPAPAPAPVAVAAAKESPAATATAVAVEEKPAAKQVAKPAKKDVPIKRHGNEDPSEIVNKLDDKGIEVLFKYWERVADENFVPLAMRIMKPTIKGWMEKAIEKSGEKRLNKFLVNAAKRAFNAQHFVAIIRGPVFEQQYEYEHPDLRNRKGLLAPNGKPSKLNQRQWEYVRTPEFKSWFGDWENDPDNSSKVLDPETGEPMVVYHVSPKKFTKFSKSYIGENWNERGDSPLTSGFYFSLAPQDIHAYTGGNFDANPFTYKVFLNIRNPFITTKIWESLSYNARIGVKKSERWAVDNPVPNRGDRGSSELQSKGYDGVIEYVGNAEAIRFLGDKPKINEIVAYEPNQILISEVATDKRFSITENEASNAVHAAQFQNIVESLRAAGMDVKIYTDAIQSAQVKLNTRTIVLGLEDITKASWQNVISIVHEAAHDLLVAMPPEIRAALLRKSKETADSVEQSSPTGWVVIDDIVGIDDINNRAIKKTIDTYSNRVREIIDIALDRRGKGSDITGFIHGGFQSVIEYFKTIQKGGEVRHTLFDDNVEAFFDDNLTYSERESIRDAGLRLGEAINLAESESRRTIRDRVSGLVAAEDLISPFDPSEVLIKKGSRLDAIPNDMWDSLIDDYGLERIKTEPYGSSGYYGDSLEGRVLLAIKGTLDHLKKNGLKGANLESARAEEVVVETFAQKLADSGFGTEAPSLAKAIWRTVKDIYYNIALAVSRAFGGPGERLAQEYYENNLKRMVGGDYSFAAVNLLSRILPFTDAQNLRRFQVSNGVEIAGYYDIATGEAVNPTVEISTADAVEWNIRHRMGGEEARARIYSASVNEIKNIVDRMRAKIAPAMAENKFWKIVANGDLPSDIIASLEKTFGPEVGKQTIDPATMTQAMLDQSRVAAHSRLVSLYSRARKAIARTREEANEKSQEALRLAEEAQEIETLYRDAEVMQNHFRQKLKEIVGEVRSDLSNGIKTGLSLGRLTAEVRRAENLSETDPIPENYQQVFQRILDEGGVVSLLDQIKAISALDLNLGSMTPAEISNAIRAAVVHQPTLNSLSQNKPLLVAVSVLVHDNAKAVDLLALRTMANTAELAALKTELADIRNASRERLSILSKTIPDALAAQGRFARLRADAMATRRKYFGRKESIAHLGEKENILIEAARQFDENIKRLEKEGVGAYSTWRPHDGSAYYVMALKDGKWVSKKKVLEMSSGELLRANAKQLAQDLAANRAWLEENQDQAGTRFYEEVKTQTQQLALIDTGRRYEADHRGYLNAFFGPIAEQFAGTGTVEGASIGQMLRRFQTIVMTNGDTIEMMASKWSHALQEVSKAAGLKHYEFIRDVYDDVAFYLQTEPGLNEDEALKAAYQRAKNRLDKVTPDFKEKLDNFLRKTKEISEHFVSIAEKEGVWVEDSRTRDLLVDGNKLLRRHVSHGWLTVMRSLDGATIHTLVREMDKAGWDKFKDIKPLEDTDDMDVDGDGMPDEIDFGSYFTPAVVRDFVIPFIAKPGKAVFFGADKSYLSQDQAQYYWHQADGDMGRWIELIYEDTKQKNGESLGEFRAAIMNRWVRLYKMEKRIAEDLLHNRGLFDRSGAKSHRMMDARVNLLLPPEHLFQETYDSPRARNLLSEIAYHAAFGRGGMALNDSLNSLQAELKDRAQHWINGGATDAERKKYAAQHGFNWKELRRAYRDSSSVNGWTDQIRSYFSYGNETSAVGDARPILRVAQLNSMLLVNQPTSALLNAVNLFDFPLVYRGIGKTGITAVSKAIKNTSRIMLEDALRTIGINMARTWDYGADVGFIGRRSSKKLPWSQYIAQQGRRELEGTRAFANIGQKIISGKNALVSPFAWINDAVSEGIALANTEVFESIVRKGIEYFHQHPEFINDPNFKFDAEKLGMKGPVYFNDEEAFNFYRNACYEYGIGGFEDVVRSAMKRQATGERLLTRDQVLATSMVAIDQITLNAGLSSRPAWFYSNVVCRWGGLLIGWPLAKMNQIANLLKGVDGERNVKTILRGVGVLASWTLPIGLAYSLLMDEYDEKMKGKKRNWQGVDSVGGILERISRVGTFGLAGDFVASTLNWVDPKAGMRSFDLNSRVLIFSQLDNLRRTITNTVAQRAFTYESGGRGLVMLAGLNGPLEYSQILNNALGLDNMEARVTDRINVNNWLRVSGRQVGIEVRSSAGASSPTPLSVWVRQMQLAAYANDRGQFLESYRNALEVARSNGEEDPQRYVVDAFKQRNPLASNFARRPSDQEYAKMLEVMSESGRTAVVDALRLHETYAEMIAPTAIEQAIKRRISEYKRSQQVNPESIRKRLIGQMMRI